MHSREVYLARLHLWNANFTFVPSLIFIACAEHIAKIEAQSGLLNFHLELELKKYLSLIYIKMSLYIEDWDFESPMFACVNPDEICPIEQNEVPALILQVNNENLYPTPAPANQQIIQQLSLQKALSKQRQERLKARLDKQPMKVNYQVRKPSGKKMTGRERQKELERQEALQLQLRDRHLDMINQLESKCNKLREILENIVATSPEYNTQIASFLQTSELLFDGQEALCEGA